MDAQDSMPDGDTAMDAPPDPRINRPSMSVEAGPSRCHMETSFYNILHSSGFAEWAARADEQNQRLRSGVWTRRSDCDAASTENKADVAAPSLTATATRPAPKVPRRATRSRKSREAEVKRCKTPSTRSKRSEGGDEEQREEKGDASDSCPTPNLVAHYSNYSSMDTELGILAKHLMQHGGC